LAPVIFQFPHWPVSNQLTYATIAAARIATSASHRANSFTLSDDAGRGGFVIPNIGASCASFTGKIDAESHRVSEALSRLHFDHDPLPSMRISLSVQPRLGRHEIA